MKTMDADVAGSKPTKPRLATRPRPNMSDGRTATSIGRRFGSVPWQLSARYCCSVWSERLWERISSDRNTGSSM